MRDSLWLLGFSNLQWVTVDENVLGKATALMAKYTLHPCDSIHVASVISRQIKSIISDDEDIDHVEGNQERTAYIG